MRSTSSCSNTLIREELIRGRIVPLILLIAYALATIIPFGMNYRSYESVAYYANEVMRGGSFLILMIHCIAAVTVSVLVMSYLHSPAASVAAHSLPVTRTRLLMSKVTSGFLMLAVPVIIIGFLMLIFHGAKGSPDSEYWAEIMKQASEAKTLAPDQLFTLPHIIRWIGISLVEILFVYSVSVLAGVLAANGIIHALLAYFLNGVIFVLASLTLLHVQSFVFGYESGIDMLSLFAASSAPAYALSHGGLKLAPAIIYLAVSLVIMAVSILIYKKVRLERVGIACFFPIAADVVSILLTLICASSCALFAVALTEDGSGRGAEMSYLLWFAIASVLFFMITRMIADSSLRVFTLRSLKKFGVYIIIAAVFTSFAVFDLTGIGKRLPEASKVASVTISASPLTCGNSVRLEDPDSIQTLILLQDAIIQEKDIRLDEDEDESVPVSLTYKMKNGSVMARGYVCGTTASKFPESNQLLRKSVSLKEFREKNRVRVPMEIARCELWNIDDDSLTIARKDIPGLVDAYNKDIRSMDYDTLLDRLGAEDLNYSFELYSSDDSGDDSKEADWGDYSFSTSYKNTTKYLKEKGYIK